MLNVMLLPARESLGSGSDSGRPAPLNMMVRSDDVVLEAKALDTGVYVGLKTLLSYAFGSILFSRKQDRPEILTISCTNLHKYTALLNIQLQSCFFLLITGGFGLCI